MKKSKILLVTVLALVLCLLCVTTSTFSWLQRPKEDKGNALAWNPSYETSVGKDISMTTVELNEDGSVPDLPVEVSDFSNTGGLASGSRKYYRTDIKNSGTEAQSVSLFLSSLDMGIKDGSFHIGVNSPLRTYKSYPSESIVGDIPIQYEIYRQNVYVGLESVEESENKFTNRNLSVHSWDYDSDCSWSNAKNTGKTRSWSLGSNYWENASRTFNIYAFEIDSRSTKFQIVDKDGKRTDAMPTISSNNTIVYFEWKGGYHSQEKNSLVENSVGGAKIDTFYSSAKVKVDDTVSIPATGTNITYSSSNTSVATVSTDGTVTGVSNGTATITATSTGAYGDTITAECVVFVSDSNDNSIHDVPIVTNVRVEAASGEADTKKDTVVSIYWYIKNEGSNALTYSIDDIYLSL